MAHLAKLGALTEELVTSITSLSPQVITFYSALIGAPLGSAKDAHMSLN
jgi:hypothetical protein